jgi:hypothetical protein
MIRTELLPDSRTAAWPTPRQVCIPLFALLLIAGLSSLAASFVPFDLLVAKARGMSARGQINFFNQSFYHDIQFRLRFIGMGNVALAFLGIALRKRAYEIAQQIRNDFVRFGKDCRSVVISLSANDLLGLAGLTLFASLLRFPLLFQPMRGDEAYTFLTYASHPFYVALSFYNDTNNHLFHTFLMRLSFLAFGNHPWALRLPVFLAGLCLVPATYWAGRCLYRRESALLAAALVASSSALIEYSVTARGYSLLCLEFMLLIPIASYALREQNLAAWFSFTVLGAIGFYTMPIMLYPFGGIVVWLLLSIASSTDHSARRRAVIQLVVVVALAAFLTIELYSPVFAISGPRAVFGKKLTLPRPIPVFIHELPNSLIVTWRQWNRDIPNWGTLVLACGFILALFLHRLLSKQRVPLIFAMLLWVVPLVIVQRVVPMDRVWLFALPLYLIAASAGCSLAIMPILERMRFRQAFSMVAVMVGLLLGIEGERSSSVYLANEGRGLPEIAVYLKAQLKPGDSVLAAVPSDTLLLYYFQQYGVPSSYLNAPNSDRVLVIVNEHENNTLRTVLKSADRNKLEDDSSKLMAKYDTASLYEISAHQPKDEGQKF